jgi:hypothetical protein
VSSPRNFDPSGLRAGGYASYNWQIAAWEVGLVLACWRPIANPPPTFRGTINLRDRRAFIAAVLKVLSRHQPRANPVPQGLDFLRRLSAAGVLGDAEAGRDRILKIDARGQHRFGEYAKAN